ncbi:MAG: BrnT family toxin [Clostridiales bacterium]|nr:BrnT family toxin [Clostridiales bacterium]
MSMIQFEWDDEKNKSNIRKHAVSFDEARTVFYDENAKLISDPDGSMDEERFIILGISRALRILVVCHCYRESESVIRIISARKATSGETKIYGG